jgi:predicted nucleic acid-binding protein
MRKIIVSDTSCLILLEKIGRIALLESLFGKITITSVIADEFGKPLPDFIEIEDAEDKKYQQILESILDAGEASAIALALEKDDCLLIMDESKGRREAKQLRIKLTGTVGILIFAKEKGLIKSVTEIIEQIRRTDFRISEDLIQEAKRKSNE